MSLELRNYAGIDIRLLRPDDTEIWTCRFGRTDAEFVVPFSDLYDEVTWELSRLGQPRCRGGVSWTGTEMVFDRGNIDPSIDDIVMRVLDGKSGQHHDQTDNSSAYHWAWDSTPGHFWNRCRVVIIFSGQEPTWTQPQ